MTALREIGLKPTMADPNVCIRAAMRPDGYEYYEIIIVYVDYIMIVSNLCDDLARRIGDYYKIKGGSQVLPMWYLGADTEKIQNKDEHEMWKTSSRSYITNDMKLLKA